MEVHSLDLIDGLGSTETDGTDTASPGPQESPTTGRGTPDLRTKSSCMVKAAEDLLGPGMMTEIETMDSKSVDCQRTKSLDWSVNTRLEMLYLFSNYT